MYISRGQSFASIVDSLETKGIIRSRSQFVFVARMIGGAHRLHVGKYVFRSGLSNHDIIGDIREGRGIVSIPVTLREGIRSQAQARVLRRVLGIDSVRYVSLAHDPAFIQSLGIQAGSLEGYLLPETYGFNWQPDEKDILRTQVNQFKEFYSDSLRQRAKELGWTTGEALTLASIVEGEAVLPEERKTIAGVYHNRLKRGMKLEADPTIQFAIADGPRRLFYSDLRIDHPYNTYLHTGLPPGPINNPGRAAIEAALYPARHNYIYFVANGRGGHWFSSSYTDHLKYVRMYRRLRSHLQSASIGRPMKTTKAPA